MATKISEQELANLAINLVKSPSAFQQMQQANQIQPDEFYLVEGDDAATYTFQDFTNGRFIVNQTKNGVVTPMTINTGSITGGSAITNDATVIGGIVPTGVQGYELSALKKTISGKNGVVVSASGTNSILIGLDAVTGLTAGSVGPISAISPAHGETVSIPYITYDTYGRITSAVNRVLTLPAETQLSAAVPDGVTTYGVGQANDFYVIGGLTTANHKITVAKKKLSAGAAMTIATASNEIVIAHSDTSTLAAGAHNAGDGAFIRSITTDEYGHITAVSTANETAETQLSGGSGEENLKVITGISVNNHEINVAKRTLSATGALSIASGTDTFNITHNQSVLAASTYVAGDKSFIKSITTDAYGHITGYTFGTESTAPTISIDSNASDPNHATLIAGLTAENYLIKVARKTITAGTGIAVANTTSAITIALASGVSSVAVATDTLTHGGSLAVPVPTVDTYGRVTKVTTITYTMPSESGLQGGSANGDDFNVVTGVTGSGHTLSVAKKTLTAGTGIALSKSSTALTIALSTLNSAGSYGPGSGVSATSTSPTEVAFGGSVLVPYVTIDSYGRTSAASTKYYKLPTISAASNAGTDANSAAVIAGLTTSGTTAVTINPAKKTITAGSGMVVTANSAAITIGIQSLTVSASAATASLAHGGMVALPSSITVNNLGQVTEIKTTTYKMPAETQLSISNNAGITNCELINSITVNNHAITLTKSKIVAGTAIAVASKNNNGQYNIEISHGSTNAASTLTPAADTFINGLTLDSFGHVVGISTAVESTGASLSVSSNAGDNGMVITGMTLGGDHNHEITIVKRKISAGNAITVSTETEGEIIINHSDTSSAVSISSTAGKFVNAISVDGYGHVRSMSTTSETVLSQSGTIGTEDSKVITGLQVSGHSIGTAKKTLEGLNGVTVTNATDKLSIGLTTTVTAAVASNYYGATGATSGVSSNKTLSYSSEANRTFYVPYIKVNDRGRIVAIGSNSVVIPSSVAIAAGTNSGATADTTVVGGISASNATITAAKKTLSGTNGISVTASSNTGISIGISTINVSVTSGTKTLNHGDTITVTSSVAVNTLGQTTTIKNIALTLPSETGITFKNGVSGGDNGQVITGFTFSGHEVTSIARRSIVGGGMVIVNTDTAGQISIAHSTPSSVGSNITAASGKFLSGITLDSYGHVTAVASAAETSISLSTVTGKSGGNVNLQFVTGLTLDGTHKHQLTIERKAIAVNTGALSISEADAKVTISHNTITPTSSAVTSSRTYINSLTFDAYGHIKSYTTNTESVESGTQNRLAYYSGTNAISSATNLYADNSSITIGSSVAPDGPAGTIFQVVGNSVTKNIYPDITNIQDLGSLLRRWQSGYFSNNISITASAIAADPVADEFNGIYLDGTNGHIHISHESDPLMYFYNNVNRSNTILHALSSTLNLVSNLYLPQVTSLVEDQTGGLLTYAAYPCSGVGSLISPTYVTTAGEVVKTAYDLSATVNSGLANHVAWYSGDNNVVSAISMTTSGAKLGVNMDVVPSTYTYNSRSTEPMLEVNGIIAAHNVIETPAYFMNNTVAADSSNGYYLRANNVTISRLYLSAVGTETQLGESIFYVGNNIVEGSDNNSRGRIRIYSRETNYVQIMAQPASDSNTFILPRYLGTGDMYAVHAGSNNAVGSHIKPVYVEADGRIAPITGTVGTGTKPIYLSSGTLTVSGSTVGANSIPVYLNAGTITAVTPISAANAFLNALSTGSSTPVDADYYISQYVGGGTTTTTYHRRPMSALWAYINGKITANRQASGTANRLAYYSSATKIVSASSLASNGIYIERGGISTSWVKGRDGAMIKSTSIAGYSAIFSIKTKNGSWQLGAYDETSYQNNLVFSYTSDTNYNANSNTSTNIRFYADGHIYAAGHVYATSALGTGNYGTAAPTTATAQWGNGSLYFQYV